MDVAQWPQLPTPGEVIDVSGTPEKQEDLLKIPATSKPRVSKLPFPKNYNTRSSSTSEEPFNRSISLDAPLKFIPNSSSE